MRPYFARWLQQFGLAAIFATMSAAGTAAVAAEPDRAIPAARDVDVTNDDVSASNQKIKSAYDALVSMWSADFKQVGAQFVAPAVVRYRGNVRTSCGIMHANNAEYCPQLNTIYFDEVFLARQAKSAAAELGTDGDMAAVGVIAHEMGHAVAIQLGESSDVPYENEAAADCLAGAFTQRSEHDGSLEKGDLQEAFFGLAAAGDPTPQFTGDQRIDRRISLRAALLGHGTRDQRLSNFTAGYKSGAKACLAVFR
jgi:predicted metalloprotease